MLVEIISFLLYIAISLLWSVVGLMESISLLGKYFSTINNGEETMIRFAVERPMHVVGIHGVYVTPPLVCLACAASRILWGSSQLLLAHCCLKVRLNICYPGALNMKINCREEIIF